jgi:hypothetical protein
MLRGGDATEMGRPISSRAAADLRRDLVGVPKRCVEPDPSRNASSIDTRSTHGVKSRRTSITASPRRWYSEK